jgi:hypothetical protein
MKVFLTILAALLLVIPSYAQEVVRDLGTFTHINLACPATVYITQGKSQKLTLEGNQEDIEKILTEVRGNKLNIKTAEDNSWFTWKSTSSLRNVTIHITVVNLESIGVSGSGQIISKTPLKTSSLDLSIAGSGSMKIQADAPSVSMKISGSGSIEVEGKSKNNEISIAGSGSIYAEKLLAENYDIAISGSGSCRIFASQSLNSRIAGSGNIYYRGNPENVNNKTAGSGRIKKIS